MIIPAPPPDLDEGVLKYLEFNDLDPGEIGLFFLKKLPSKVEPMGTMKEILYRSTKWEGKAHDYIHEHESGVILYTPSSSGKQLPEWIRSSQTLVKLGVCLGFTLHGHAGEIDYAPSYPELYCTACGHALVIVYGKKKIDAIIWGGKLRITAHGIEG